jgi:hypothetical protein
LLHHLLNHGVLQHLTDALHAAHATAHATHHGSKWVCLEGQQKITFASAIQITLHRNRDRTQRNPMGIPVLHWHHPSWPQMDLVQRPDWRVPGLQGTRAPRKRETVQGTIKTIANPLTNDTTRNLMS